MIYKINYTRLFINDLTGIIEYIINVLHNKSAAKNLSDRIKKSIDLLSIAPLMHKLYDVDPWNKKNMHMFSVKNYTVFYTADLEHKEVYIVRILYKRMDLNEQLKRIY